MNFENAVMEMVEAMSRNGWLLRKGEDVTIVVPDLLPLAAYVERIRARYTWLEKDNKIEAVYLHTPYNTVRFIEDKDGPVHEER